MRDTFQTLQLHAVTWAQLSELRIGTDSNMRPTQNSWLHANELQSHIRDETW